MGLGNAITKNVLQIFCHHKILFTEPLVMSYRSGVNALNNVTVPRSFTCLFGWHCLIFATPVTGSA
jgi:hypothetical protein